MSRASTQRRDIQGLRAFAVTAVVLDHLLGWPHGGFVGVDVFFVISGFLITGILLREHERTGTISFVGFYRRRAKRILPASILVLAVTVALSYALVGRLRADSIATDGLWALFFGANWRFTTQATDYFAANGPVSPLQHYWSLAVEEQFYFVWPWLMLGVLALLAARTRRRTGTPPGATTRPDHHRLVVGLVLAGVVAASFAWALQQTSAAPSAAYFSTFTRVWELGLGALVAVAAPLCARIPDAVRPVLAWGGLVGMTASLWLVTEDAGFPAPAAALPVGATALVIAAGTFAERGRQQRFLLPLTNRVAGYVGDISYSLYLWHFPVAILGVVVLGDSPLVLAGLGVVMLVLAVHSYHLVEEPLRSATWRLPRRTSREAGAGRRGTLRAAYTGVFLLALAAAPLMPSLVLADNGVRTLSDADVAAIDAETHAEYTPAVADLQTEIRVALAAGAWPELDPPIEEAMAGREVPSSVMPCGDIDGVDVAACTFGELDRAAGGQSIAVVGDSIAVNYVPLLVGALPEGWSLTSLGAYGCPFTDLLSEHPDAAIVDGCEQRKADVVDAVEELRPDVLVVADMYAPRTEVGEEGTITPERWAESTRTQLGEVADAVGRTVVLAPPPSDVNIDECYNLLSSPVDCVSKVRGQWSGMHDAEAAMAEEMGATYVDSRDWFCAEDRCPAFVGDTLVKVDLVHFSQPYQRLLQPAFTERLGTLGVLPPPS
ncbi:peptidoglycan/LPS O-acetylase OafA/YrhL [Nocardioides zeae]|uniref:Peptidoglycan/LPS O-acetylase OafA/YrhL n=1 Tax=Nocardioides zeae TaxID=1457234 RepID=A0ACC6IN38_9ACTN|nr:acyltransferase family protein [Nocardioides zeae]MDR6174428.1 peptidoglycan/LPS O-acetylase OafA/YrhL [Nocardioides zeae]MDR6212149.1 peptidoglycan/LPS O-acetylase OafA/YrhL [Nocardioides zeae]